MKEISVRTADLLEALKTNRAKHLEEYTKLQGEYVAAAKKLLEKSLESLDPTKSLSVRLEAPTSNIKDYDTATLMLEMHTEPTILLEQDEFKQYVQDEWGWKRIYEQLSTSYTAR